MKGETCGNVRRREACWPPPARPFLFSGALGQCGVVEVRFEGSSSPWSTQKGTTSPKLVFWRHSVVQWAPCGNVTAAYDGTDRPRRSVLSLTLLPLAATFTFVFTATDTSHIDKRDTPLFTVNCSSSFGVLFVVSAVRRI